LHSSRSLPGRSPPISRTRSASSSRLPRIAEAPEAIAFPAAVSSTPLEVRTRSVTSSACSSCLTCADTAC
jgi:hypothetical protein